MSSTSSTSSCSTGPRWPRTSSLQRSIDTRDGTERRHHFNDAILAADLDAKFEVDIDVIEWGSSAESLKVLAPRKSNRRVRQMILALSKDRDDARAEDLRRF